MRRPIGGDDDSLIQRVVCGDTAAFAALVRRHRPWVCRLLRAFTHNSDSAEDLAQEVFTRLHRHAASYRSRGQFVAYLKRIALNVGRSHLRREGNVTLVCFDELTEATDENVLDEVLARGVAAEVRTAIEALPTDQREAVLLHYFAGLTVPEIATRAACPEGTVKSRLFHGIRKVRATLEETEETP